MTAPVSSAGQTSDFNPDKELWRQLQETSARPPTRHRNSASVASHKTMRVWEGTAVCLISDYKSRILSRTAVFIKFGNSLTTPESLRSRDSARRCRLAVSLVHINVNAISPYLPLCPSVRGVVVMEEKKTQSMMAGFMVKFRLASQTLNLREKKPLRRRTTPPQPQTVMMRQTTTTAVTTPATFTSSASNTEILKDS